MSGQVRAGYKLTEAGVIPEDWEVKMLKQISPIQSVGLVINPSSYYDDAGTVPMLVGSNVSENAIDWASSKRISELSNAKVGATRVFTGDLVTVRVGEPGVTAVIPPEIDGCNCASMMIVRRHYSFDSTWLCCLMNSKYGRMQVENVQYGTAQKQFNISDAVCFSYPVPPLVEQRAIAAALSDMDTLIRGLDQLIAKKRDIKQAAMQQLLTGQQRLPGFAPPMQLFKNTQVGRMPEDWEIARLGDLVDPSRSIRYGIVQPGRYDPQGRYMLRGQDYSEAKGWANPSDVFRVSPEVEERYRNARVKKGDLIMTIVGYCGHVEIIPAWLDGANLTQTTVRIAIDPGKAISTYCKYVLLDSTGKNQVAAYMKGAAQPGLNCGDIEQFLVPMPTIPEQAAIATILSDMDSELTTLECRCDKARQLKQGMMQELLTGKTRLI